MNHGSWALSTPRLRAVFIIVALVPLVGAVFVPAASVPAADGEALERRVLEITDQLRCPTCQAISVKDSAAGFSRQITGKVRAMLKEGQSEEEIKAFFVARYGEWILRAPKKQGVGLILWLLPGLAITAVGGWVGYVAFRASRRGEDEPEGGRHGEIGEAERDRIERDLRRFEEGN